MFLLGERQIKGERVKALRLTRDSHMSHCHTVGREREMRVKMGRRHSSFGGEGGRARESKESDRDLSHGGYS